MNSLDSEPKKGISCLAGKRKFLLSTSCPLSASGLSMGPAFMLSLTAKKRVSKKPEVVA
jgi:hypothetical protein